MYIGTFSNDSERTKHTCDKFLIPGVLFQNIYSVKRGLLKFCPFHPFQSYWKFKSSPCTVRVASKHEFNQEKLSMAGNFCIFHKSKVICHSREILGTKSQNHSKMIKGNTDSVSLNV
jgi:hypothetical protein